jgi:hypothetical protein
VSGTEAPASAVTSPIKLLIVCSVTLTNIFPSAAMSTVPILDSISKLVRVTFAFPSGVSSPIEVCKD